MNACDLCNRKIEKAAKCMTAARFREAVLDGLRPPKTGLFNKIDESMKKLGGTQEYIDESWKLQAVASRTDWKLCSACFALAKAVTNKKIACNKCGREAYGLTRPWADFEKEPLAIKAKTYLRGYLCINCGAGYCDACKKKELKFSWWSGFKKSACPACGQPFGPGWVLFENM